MRGMGGITLTRRQFNGGLAAAGALAAVGGLSDSAYASTQSNYLGWQGYEEVWKQGGFSEKNGIVVNAQFQDSNDQAIAKITGGGMGSMDIITPDTAYTEYMHKLGIVEKLDLGRIPNFQELYPFFRTMHGSRLDGVQWSLPFSWTIIPLMYNTKYVKEPPTSWHDMTKPEYKGKIGLTTDMISMWVVFTLAVTGKPDATHITKDELKEVLAFMVNLKKNYARAVANSYGELTDLLATGEVWLAQGWVPVQVWAADKGASVKWVIPKEGAHAPIDCMAMVNKAPNVDANYKLLNQSMSAKGQAYAANINASGVTNAKAVALLDQKIRDLQPYDDIPGFYKKMTGGQPLSLWPTEPDGDLATFDDVLNAWEKFLAA